MSKRKDFFDELFTLVPQDSPIVLDIVHALGTDPHIDAYYIRPETVMGDDSVYDSIRVHVISSGKLILIVSDISYEFSDVGEFITTTICTELSSIRDYHLIRRRMLDGEDKGGYTGVVMTLRWGGGLSIDAVPAACDNPDCHADHGYVGRLTAQDADIVLDGTLSQDVFRKGLAFIEELASRIRRAGH